MKKQIILVSSVLLFAGAGCAAVQSTPTTESVTEAVQTDKTNTSSTASVIVDGGESLSAEALELLGISDVTVPEDWVIEETQMELIESVAIHHDDPVQGRYEGEIVYPNQAQLRLNFLAHDLKYQELMESQFTGEEAVFTEPEDDSPYGYTASSEETFTTVDGYEGRLFLAQADYAENHYSGSAIINHNGTYRRIGIWLGNGDMNTELNEELLTMLRSLSFSEDDSADIAE